MSDTYIFDAASARKRIFSIAVDDFSEAIRMWSLIFYLGFDDIRQRYVRTMLGPLWLTIGTGIWIGVMSFVSAALFGNSIKQTLPFVSSGILIWNFIATTMNESCNLFVGFAPIIQSIRLPISVHILRFLVRNLIIFGHNLVILLLIFILCRVNVNFNTLLAIPGLFLVCINAIWVSTAIGFINTRYRDIQQIIATSMTILPFVTPIFWEKTFLKKHHWIADINPFYHYVEIVRGPLLGERPALLSWLVVLSMTIIGILVTTSIFSKYKHRLIFWL